MSKTISCAGCGQKFNLTPNLLGKRVKCPKCGNKTDIPLPVAKRIAPVATQSADEDLALKALSDLIPDAGPSPEAEIPGLIPLELAPTTAEIPGLVPLAAESNSNGLMELTPLAAAPASPFAATTSDPFGAPSMDLGGLAALPATSAPVHRAHRQVEADPPGTMKLIYICSGIAGTAMFILLIVIAVNAYQQAEKARQLAEQNAPKPPPVPSATNTPLTPTTTLTPASNPPPASLLNLPKFPDLGSPQPLPTGEVTYTIDLTNFAGNNATEPGMAMRMRVYLPPGEHPTKSLPCLLMAPLGTNLLWGSDINPISPEYTENKLTYVAEGMAVVEYSLDGSMPLEVPVDNVAKVKALADVYTKFKASKAGILNGQHALEFVLAKLPQVNSDKIYSVGHGTSATTALLLAEHEPRIKACVACAAVIEIDKSPLVQIFPPEIYDKIFPGMLDFLKQYSPATHAAKLRCPVFLFRPTDKLNLSIDQSITMAKLLEAAGNKPTFIESTGSPDGSMHKECISQSIKWLKSLSTPTEPMPMNQPPLTPPSLPPMPITPPNSTPVPGLNEVPGTVPMPKPMPSQPTPPNISP